MRLFIIGFWVLLLATLNSRADQGYNDQGEGGSTGADYSQVVPEPSPYFGEMGTTGAVDTQISPEPSPLTDAEYNWETCLAVDDAEQGEGQECAAKPKNIGPKVINTDGKWTVTDLTISAGSGGATDASGSAGVVATGNINVEVDKAVTSTFPISISTDQLLCVNSEFPYVCTRDGYTGLVGFVDVTLGESRGTSKDIDSSITGGGGLDLGVAQGEGGAGTTEAFSIDISAPNSLIEALKEAKLIKPHTVSFDSKLDTGKINNEGLNQILNEDVRADYTLTDALKKDIEVYNKYVQEMQRMLDIQADTGKDMGIDPSQFHDPEYMKEMIQTIQDEWDRQKQAQEDAAERLSELYPINPFQ